MFKKVRCNICKSSHYALFFKPSAGKKDFPDNGLLKVKELGLGNRVVECLKCSLVYLNPQSNIAKLYKYYSDVAVSDFDEDGERICARRILSRLQRLKPTKGKMLCIGCAGGFILDEAKKMGWQVSGIDLSNAVCQYIKEKFAIDVFRGSLRKAKFPTNAFDAVLVYGILEHLTQPMETLIEARRILKKDGIIFINTHNIASFYSKALKANWWGIKEKHLFYFTKKTLFKLLTICGFKAIYSGPCAMTHSLKFWHRRFKEANLFIYKLLYFISQHFNLENRLFTVSSSDKIAVYAKKARQLANLEEFETKQTRLKKLKHNCKIIVVLPAFNAAKTLKKTVSDIPKDFVDEIILVDDASYDNTIEVAKHLGLITFRHEKNMGYGGNQKTCYSEALKRGADIVVMVHPDYQYDPKAIPELIQPIKQGYADAVFGSRMMKGGALEGGMPTWKHNANILLTALENVALSTYLTEYHSGFRAYSRHYLQSVNFMANSNGFVFDTEIIVQGLIYNMRIEEVPIKTRYFDEASTIKFWPSVRYGFSILKTLLKFSLHQQGVVRFKQFG